MFFVDHFTKGEYQTESTGSGNAKVMRTQMQNLDRTYIQKLIRARMMILEG